MFLFPDFWKYMNIICTKYLIIFPLWLEAKTVFQDIVYGTNQEIFTRFNILMKNVSVTGLLQPDLHCYH